LRKQINHGENKRNNLFLSDAERMPPTMNTMVMSVNWNKKTEKNVKWKNKVT